MVQGYYGGAGGIASGSGSVASVKGQAGSAHNAAADAPDQRERKINAIQTIVKDGKVIVAILLDGRMASWVEYDPEQLDGLIDLLKAARAQI